MSSKDAAVAKLPSDKMPSAPKFQAARKSRKTFRRKNRISAAQEIANFKIKTQQVSPNNYGFDAGADGQVAAQHEICYQVTDYFDVTYSDSEATSVLNYWIGVEQSPFGSGVAAVAGGADVALRIQKLWLYAMPLTQFGGNETESIADALYRVQFRLPSRMDEDEGTVQGMCNRSTDVHPDYNQGWKLVGHYNIEESFKSGLYRPVIQTDSLVPGNGKCMLAFQVQALNPDDFTPLDNGKPVQYKVVYEIAQPLPLVNTFALGTVLQENFTFVDIPFVENSPVLIDVKRMNSNKY